MSNINLKKLAEEAKKLLAESEESRTTYYNKEPHSYSVARSSIIKQALVQVGRSKDTITEDELDQLTTSATAYCKRLHDAFQAQTNRGVKVYAKSKINFYVVIFGVDAYELIYRTRVSEGGGLRKFTNELRKIFPDSAKIHSVAFDVGHVYGGSIADRRIDDALKMFVDTPKITGPGSRAINKVISIAIRSRERTDSGKSFYIEVIDESATENRRKGSAEEKKWIQDTKNALNSMIKNVDWANQRSSRSAVEAVLSELLSTSKKGKAKIKGKIFSKGTPSKASSKLVIKGKNPKEIKSDLVGDISIAKKEKTPSTNWSSLIGIINAKLPQKVATNMGAPGLVYRTGTFANSTKVVNVENTKQGYPSIVFDYQRDPYDIFDKTKGKAPWNTPARDPRALVDRSVREIVREMAIGKFFTRRA